MIDTMKSIVPKTTEQAPDAICLMVANPVDVATYTGWELSGLSDGRFFGSGTVLDPSRLRYLTVLACGVASWNVHTYIAGEHSDPEIPLWSSTMVSAIPLLQWGQTVDGKLLDDGVREATRHDIVHLAYNIIGGKGVANCAIGVSVTSVLGLIVRDEHRVLPVSPCLEDWLNISDVCTPAPSVMSRAGVGRRFVPVITSREYDGLRHPIDSIRDVTRQFGPRRGRSPRGGVDAWDA